jgi:hypothetical protein
MVNLLVLISSLCACIYLIFFVISISKDEKKKDENNVLTKQAVQRLTKNILDDITLSGCVSINRSKSINYHEQLRMVIEKAINDTYFEQNELKKR